MVPYRCPDPPTVIFLSLPFGKMSKISTAILSLLVLSVMVSAAPGRKALDVDSATANEMEHQRVLAELEEVHQLRERMLQEGGNLFTLLYFAKVQLQNPQQFCLNYSSCCLIANASFKACLLCK